MLWIKRILIFALYSYIIQVPYNIGRSFARYLQDEYKQFA